MRSTQASSCFVLLLLLVLASACSRARTAELADASAPDAGSCAGALTWIDPSPLVRSRTRYVTPVLTGDHDGFLFVTTVRAPERCGAPPCIVAERFASSGAEARRARVPFEMGGEQIQLFAGTDPAGAAHLAASAPSRAEQVSWFGGPTWSDEAGRLALDPARGLGAVAFGAGEVWVLTHGWMSENTIGEGHDYPIAPELVRVAPDGSRTIEPDLDPTEGELFVRPALRVVDHRAWLVTTGFYQGPLRVAGPSWRGVLREAPVGLAAAVALRSGALVVAYSSDEDRQVVRIAPDGALTRGPVVEPSRFAALATDGARIVLAHATDDGDLHVTVLDEDLSVIATGPVPGGGDRFTHVELAAATGGTFAILTAPPPAHDPSEPEPVEIRRFRACE